MVNPARRPSVTRRTRSTSAGPKGSLRKTSGSGGTPKGVKTSRQTGVRKR